ncbi:MAG: 3-hydroxyacyl-CoA dehydrogenase family protein, partial [Candidatus Lokiarchaeota archaeon]
KEEPGTILERLHLEVNLQNAVKNADFIIEAIPEIMTLKKELFGKLDNLAPKHCILASNTSSLSLTEIGEGVERQDKIIGMHFFIPVPVLRLIEIVRGKFTSDETVEKTVNVGKNLPALQGKRVTPIIQKESPGFIVNRLTCASSIYLNWLLDYAEENNIPCDQIDADVLNVQKMGFFATWDYLGLDTIYNVLNYFTQELSPAFSPGKKLTRLVKEGNLGRKTGEGIYEWHDGKPIIEKDKSCGIFDLELFFAIQLNEGCRLLNEDIVDSPQVIDDAMIAGMNTPGPFKIGKKYFEKWSKKLEEFAEKTGIDYLKPCELMKSGKFSLK